MKNKIKNKTVLVQCLIAFFFSSASSFAVGTGTALSIKEEQDLVSKSDDMLEIEQLESLELPLSYQSATKEYSVWFAEDQTSIRKPFERIFKINNTNASEDWKLKMFVHEDEAIAYAKENKQTMPDCVITDINMNHAKGGVHFAKFLREDCVAATSAPEALTPEERHFFDSVGDKILKQQLDSIKSHIRKSLCLSTPEPIHSVVPPLQLNADTSLMHNSAESTERTLNVSIDFSDPNSVRPFGKKAFLIARTLQHEFDQEAEGYGDKKNEPRHNALEEKQDPALQYSTITPSINEIDNNDQNLCFSCCWPWQSLSSRNKVNPQRNVSGR